IAGVTELRAHETFETVAREFAFAFLVQTLEVRNDTFEGPRDFAHLAGARESEFDLDCTRTPEQNSFEILGQVFVRSFQALLIMTGHAPQQSFVITHHPFSTSAPGENNALFE